MKNNDFVKTYITGIANISFGRNVVFFALILVSVVAVFLTIQIQPLIKKAQNVEPVVVFVDRSTGFTSAVPFKMVGAEGDKRHEAEIYDFIGNFISQLYTFNKYTILSNLNSALNFCSDEVVSTLENTMKEERAGFANNNIQGQVVIESIEILNILPDLKVRVVFEKFITSTDNGNKGSMGTYSLILRIKTIIRQIGNSHGLKIIEYIENSLSKVEK